MWRTFYGFPDTGLQLYGITGTNGKTTTAFVLAAILRKEFDKDSIGLISTEVFWIGSKERANQTHMTTVRSKEFFKLLAEMKAAGVQHVVFELTSHALDQYRAAGLILAGAIITNITHEHLDYHGTMKEYAKAKFKIANYLSPTAPLVVRGDDEWIQKGLQLFVPDSVRSITIQFTSEDAAHVQTHLASEFNKENVLAASLLAKHVGKVIYPVRN